MSYEPLSTPLFGYEHGAGINHVITTDNLSMAALGMSSFSIEEMTKWIREDAPDGVNGNIFNITAGGPDIDIFLTPVSGNYEFLYWRNTARNGEYIHSDQPLNNSMTWSHLNSTASDLGFSTAPTDPPIVEIAAMNDQIIDLLRVDPNGSGWTAMDSGRIEFLRDIKASKSGCIQWISDLNITDGNGETNEEQVSFSFYLFDDSLVKKNSRSLTVADLKVVAPRVDNNGRIYLNKEDGELTPVENPYFPSENIATSISLSFNELAGKWESGTPQVLAILSTSIDAASGVTLSEMVSSSTVDLLDPFIGQGVTTGSAIPIRMQNANPMQWSPEYQPYTGDDRPNNDKSQVRVYNVSGRVWSSGEMVVLNKIDGVWHPLPFGSEGVSSTTSATKNGEWEFYNLSATVESYFRSSAGENFRYDEYEQAFYKAYYTGSSLNNLYQGADVTYLDVDDTFVQFTSWDFLGPRLGGLRGKNGIATTQFAERADGTPLGDNGDGKFVQAVHSSHFFGCVFPDGYDGQAKYDEYMTTSHPVLTTLGINHSDFFVGVPETLKVFAHDSDSIADTAAGPMLTDFNLRHLPADIATNASSSGVNGRPLRDIKIFPLASAGLATHVDSFMANGFMDHWMYRGTSDIHDSAFDLKPTNPSRVQFRPLKVEMYGSFEHDTPAAAAAAVANTRGEFGARCWDFVDSSTRPVAVNAVNRLMGSNIANSVSTGLRYGVDIDPALRSDNAKFPSSYWWPRSDDRPAGVIGIIGAVSTCTANSSIRFNADCFLGMKSWFINGSFYPSWGGYGGNGPHNSNTTMLYARVYHRWPRNLTVYDPRFFAVHHFNVGFDNLGDSELLSVDNQFPTDKAGNAVGFSVAIDGNSDLKPKEEWLINGQRRGKLLPYKYSYTTVGINTSSINILDGGSEYNSADEFTTSGGSGDGVSMHPVFAGGAPGVITGFALNDSADGHGFHSDDFGVAGTDTTSSVRVVPVSVTGTGFDGYCITGIVVDQYGEDTKPEIATSDELLQLTPNPPLGNDGDVVNELDELRTVEAQLSNKSSDNQYDIFYHFHNDISHTFANSWASPNAYEQAVTLEVIPL